MEKKSRRPQSVARDEDDGSEAFTSGYGSFGRISSGDAREEEDDEEDVVVDLSGMSRQFFLWTYMGSNHVGVSCKARQTRLRSRLSETR